MADLFSAHRPAKVWHGDDILHLPGFASSIDPHPHLECITQQSPFRHMRTPGGREMSAAMTNCGQVGWISDGSGYRYRQTDPLNGKHWPRIPLVLLNTADRAAQAFGVRGFRPDACLINRYAPGAKMALHQDRDEADLTQPVVSLSFGATAQFMVGGLTRSETTQLIQLEHGDALVFGRKSRLAFHGVKPLKSGDDLPHGTARFCLTFRKAL